MVSDVDVIDFHLGRWNSKGEKILLNWWKFWELIAFWEVESNHLAHYSSQQRASVYGVHLLIMNLVLGLTRLGLPCLADFSILLREDIIVAGGNSVILSRLGKTMKRKNTSKKVFWLELP